MKLINVSIICIGLLAFFTQSCSKMNDLHQKYLNEGEIIYAAKVDSVATGAGNGRIQLEMFIRAQRIEIVRIFWNDYTDSIDVQVGNQTGAMKILIENMAEKGYIFEFVSFDKYGNKSIPFEVSGSVYGDRFQSALSNRMITSMIALFNGKLIITWAGAVDMGVRCDLVYTNATGYTITRKVPMSEATTVLTDVDLVKDVKYRTLFLPEVTAIDTFYTDFKAIPIAEARVSKTEWKIIGFSSEERISEGPLNGMITAVIDDDINIYWQSQYGDGNPAHNPGYPHWFIVDMGKEVTISSIEVFRRQNYSGEQTKHQFLYSNNGTDWTDFGTFPMDQITLDGQKFRSTTTPTARYIKYVALEGPYFYAALGELNVYALIK